MSETKRELIEIDFDVIWEWRIKMHIILIYIKLDIDGEYEYVIDFKVDPYTEYNYGDYEEVEEYLYDILNRDDNLLSLYEKTYTTEKEVQETLLKFNKKHNFYVEI